MVKERVFGFGECVCERNNFKFPPKNMLPCECLGDFGHLFLGLGDISGNMSGNMRPVSQ